MSNEESLTTAGGRIKITLCVGRIKLENNSSSNVISLIDYPAHLIDPLRSWIFDESIFENRLQLAFNETGTFRSPINSTGIVTVDYHSNPRTTKIEFDLNRYYYFKVETEGTLDLLQEPRLHYMEAIYMGNPYISFTSDLYQDIIGANDSMEQRQIQILPGIAPVSISLKSNIVVSPDGLVYFLPKKSTTTSQDGNIIELNIPEDIRNRIFQSAKKATENGVNDPIFTPPIFNYNFVFSVKPTYWAVFRYIKNTLTNLENAIEDKGNAIEDKGKPEPNIVKILLKLGIKLFENDNFTKTIDKALKTSNLPNSINPSRVRKLFKILLKNEDLRLFFQSLVVENDSIPKDKELLTYLKTHTLDIPIHFWIDPMARVTNNNTDPDPGDGEG